MESGTHHIFLPGWGAAASAYAPGLPAGWTALDPPRFAESSGSLEVYLAWLAGELEARPGPLVLAGHSMGAALSVLAAAAFPHRVQHLVLFSPAGLPLVKPIAVSAAQFMLQMVTGRFTLQESLAAIANVARAPRSAYRVACAVRELDLSREMQAVSAAGIPVTIVGCDSDTLVTGRHCRRAADLLQARYRELSLEGGHMWMFGQWAPLAAELRLV